MPTQWRGSLEYVHGEPGKKTKMLMLHKKVEYQRMRSICHFQTLGKATEIYIDLAVAYKSMVRSSLLVVLMILGRKWFHC